MNGGEALVATLIAHGVDTAFCVPGESYLAVLEAVRAQGDTFRLLTHRHESGAGFAAEAHARLTRKPGIVMVTRGPGASNASIAIHVAAQDSTPLVMFVGQVPTHEFGLEAFQEVDYRQMFGGMAKAVLEPSAPGEVASVTARALSIAAGPRPGPVVVVLPEDVTEGDAGNIAVPKAASLAPLSGATAAPDRLDAALCLIADAKRPVVIAGEMLTLQGAHGALAAFADRFGGGVATAFRRQDALPADHPASFGHLGLGRAPAQKEAFESADVIIAAGARLDDVTSEGFSLIKDGQTLIHIHPDAGQIARTALGRKRPADIAIAADIAPTLDALTSGLPTTLAEPTSERVRWRDDIHLCMAAFSETPVAPMHGRIDMAAVVKSVAAMAGPDAAICIDAGNFAGWVHRYYPFNRPDTQVASSAGAMGYGVPAALGAALARPDRPTVVFVGDGGFAMTGQELATAVHERLPIKVVVCDNSVFGTILMHQHRRVGAGRYQAVELSNPDFAALARAYGLAAWTVTETAGFEAAFAEAMAHPGAALIHLITDRRDISAYGPLD